MRVYGFVGDKQAKGGDVELILRALNGHLSPKSLAALLTDPQNKADGIADRDVPLASFSLSTFLRGWVDAWINSAKTEDGEQPRKRSYSPEFLQEYIVRNPPLLRPGAEGPCLVLVPSVWDKQKRLPASVRIEWEKARSQWPDTESPSAQFMQRITPFVWDAAIALFLQLLDSPSKTRLFRCDGCGTYFFLQRLPRKDTPIKRGSWCANCKRDGRDRARRTNESRNQRTEKLIELAAYEWPRWKQDWRHGERSEWVAKQVNKKLPAIANHIAKNWVTRHQKEIEAEVERRKHAKG